MDQLVHALQNGSAQAWLFIPVAILVGALHGLEPGHSKTMMAAFIIAVRGTIVQAALLGLAAAISHSLVIWVLAAGALHFGSRWNAEAAEPYIQMVSAVAIFGLAAWMFWRTRRDALAEAEHLHEHHHHHDETKRIETAAGTAELAVFEEGVPPVFRLHFKSGERQIAPPAAATVSIETVRGGRERQVFAFAEKEGFLESTSEIPEPHEFHATLTLGENGHAHSYPIVFEEDAHHHHHHHALAPGEDFQDAHEREHAAEIEARFANRRVTTWQIVLFGLTGGLIPCPAAFSILIICLQLKRVTLGFAMVAAFSFGLALTLVSTGVIAAWSVHHAEKHFTGFGKIARRLPYFSSAFLMLVGVYMVALAWHNLHAAHS